MADVIAVASGKGGVGKSTFSWLLGGAFASMGRKTLLIDLDAGLNALDILFGVRENTVFGWNDVSVGRCSLDDAVMNCGENIDLLASPSAVTGFDSLSDITGTASDCAFVSLEPASSPARTKLVFFETEDTTI